MDKLFAPDACAAGPRGLPSVPLSPRLRLPLCRVVSEHYRSPPADKRAGRATADASGPGGILAGRREFRGLRPGRPDGRHRLPGGRRPYRRNVLCAESQGMQRAKKENPACCGALDQKRLSCMISGTGSPAGFPAFWC